MMVRHDLYVILACSQGAAAAEGERRTQRSLVLDCSWLLPECLQHAPKGSSVVAPKGSSVVAVVVL